MSQWRPQPDDEFQLAVYAAQAAEPLDGLGLGHCHWLGTSMGGVVGLPAAAGCLCGRLRRLVLSDIGPEVAPHDDPALVRQFINHSQDDGPCPAWNRLQIPVRVLRGAHSDLLPPRALRSCVVSTPGRPGRAGVSRMPGFACQEPA